MSKLGLTSTPLAFASRSAQPGLGPAPSSVALPPRWSPPVGPADAPHLHELQGSADGSFHPEAPEAGRAACSRQREVTPDAEPAQRGQGGNRGGQDHRGDVPLPGPITPDAATGHALCLSPVAEAAATGEGQQGGRASLPAAAQHAPLGTLTPGAADSALRSFVRCVEAAPLLQSALLWMELNDSHPLPEGAHKGPAARGRDLQLTLAQLLALHLRSGTPKGVPAEHAAHAVPPDPPLMCPNVCFPARWTGQEGQQLDGLFAAAAMEPWARAR